MRAIRDLLRRWRYGATPRYRIDALPDNTFGQIAGIVEPLDGELLVAPLSRRPCVAYTVVVDLYIGTYDGGEVAREQAHTAFVLRDGSHHAVIDPTHARISLGFDHTTESRGLGDAHPHHRALLERQGMASRNWGRNTLRYSEAVLQVGGRVTVIGSGAQELDPTAAEGRIYRERGPTRLRMAGSPTAPLLISDRRS